MNTFKRRAGTTSHSRSPHIWCSRRSESDDSGCRRESFSVCGLPILSLSRCPAEMRRLSSILITFYLTAITISVASAQILPRPASVDSVVVDGIVADTTAADTTVVGSDGLPSADAFTTDVDTIAAPVDGSVTATGSGSTAGTRSVRFAAADSLVIVLDADDGRSEEHTSEL